MFSNYIKIAYRNLFKYKLFSLINIGGLAIGMTCAILIMLYVKFELSYDRCFKNADNIYRIAWISDNPQTRTPHPMAQAMRLDFPEVVQAVSLSPIWGPGLTRPLIPVRYEDKRFDEPGFYGADTTFFKVFSFRMLHGDPKTALQIPGGVVITEDIAHKYFGNENPVGKTLMLEVGRNLPITVTGVMENIPANAHFHFDFLISYITLKPMEQGEYYEWSDFGHFNYVVLANGADPQALETKIPGWLTKYLNWFEEYHRTHQGKLFALQPLTSIHLHSHLRWELEPTSNLSTVYLFSSAAVLILIIGCINFMNLSTARSTNRAREIGIRKVVGAQRVHLIRQFLGESLILAILAACIAILMVIALLPLFNNISGRPLQFNPFGDQTLLLGIFVITIFVALLAGGYPSLFLSAFHPIVVLKGKLKVGMGNVTFRRIMVVFQFAISIALICGTAIVSNQLDFLRNHQLGFNKNQVIVVPIKQPAMRAQYESIKNELLQSPAILKASAVSNVPGGQFNQNILEWEEKSEQNDASVIHVDYDFFSTLDIEIAAGRAFSKDFTTDQQQFMLNESAAHDFTWDTAVDKEIIWYDDEVTRRGKVIGVVKNFNFQSLRQNIEPLIFLVNTNDLSYLLVKIRPDRIDKTLEYMRATWTKFASGDTFEYSFLDDDFNKLYQAEEHMRSIFQYFTILAIFIACLGLYGLIMYAIQQRMKEIGIRKTLGSSTHGIVLLLSKEFMRWVLYANIIAWPVAYLVMREWLTQFAYRTNINIGIFIVAAALALVIAFLTISVQAVRAALANPVESLHYE
ncbi:ABC transporter permease [candidate division KSB1 bacterium]|nr:ABC transporter permease [candidate division KSB1 bacterium]